MVLADLQCRLAALRTQLCPSQIYLQIQDQAITGMALEGRQLRWLERLPLPWGVCRHGVPLLPVALGDLIGDWLLERGYGGAHVKAVLPPSACSWRVLDPPPGLNSDGLQTWAEGMAEQLGLVWAEGGCLEAVDVLCEPLGEGQPQLLLVVVARGVLEGWMEVMDQAGCDLVTLQPACLCGWNGLASVREASVQPWAIQGLLLADTQQTWLFALSQHFPVAQWCLPRVEAGSGWPESLRFLLQFGVGGVFAVSSGEQQELLLAGDGSQAEAMEALLAPQVEALHAALRLVDLSQTGGLEWQSTPAAGDGGQGVPWLLWGLAAPDLPLRSP